MAAELFEDALDLETPTLEPVPPELSRPESEVCYPYPRLRETGQSVKSLRSLILENPYLRATWLPDLGGRMIELLDRRTGSPILPRVGALRSRPHPSGRDLPGGLEIVAGRWPRPNRVGPVDVQARAGDDDAPATLLFHELVAGQGLSWHASWSMPAAEAGLDLSVRVQNRLFLPVEAPIGLAIDWPGGELLAHGDTIGLFDEARDVGLALLGLPAGWSVRHEESTVLVSWDFGVLLPRETLSFGLRFAPFSGIGRPDQVTADGALRAHGGVALQVARPFPGARVYLLTQGGQTFEAPADLHPEAAFVVEESSLPAGVFGVAARSESKEEIVRVEGETVAAWSPSITPRSLAREAILRAKPGDGTAEGAYLSAVRFGEETQLPVSLASPIVRPAALVLMAQARLSAGNVEAAEAHLEDALGFAAEDALTWWMKAAVARHAGQAEAERPELMNAHFLAPLEPVLRAESFLSQPGELTRDPSPLVAPLADDPEALIEVAVQLLEAGLAGDAARWIDEALRHREEPMLRYLYAWSLLRSTRMEAEAADQVARVAARPIEAPFPWRALERQAIQTLAGRFPEDARLASLAKIVATFVPDDVRMREEIRP